MLRVEGLSAREIGLGPFDLEVKRSLAVLGPNGSGQSLFLDALVGMFAAQGRVSFHHYLLNRHSLQGQLLVGFLASPPDFEEHLSGFRWLDLIGGLYRLSTKVRRERILALADDFGSNENLYRPLNGLSAATRLRIGLMAAWLGEPRLLVLDQPTNFLDPQAKEGLIERLAAHHNQGGVSVIATHDLVFAAAVADQFLFLANGRDMAHGSLAELANLLQTRKNLEDCYRKLYYGQIK